VGTERVPIGYESFLMFEPGSRVYGLMHDAGHRLHEALARHPRLAERWFSALAVMRHAPAGFYKQRITNSVTAVHWPELAIRPQRVTLGSATEVLLRPHPGEFDFGALLEARLAYEPEVFAWLERELPSYQTVVEIGANVGVFTVFMTTLKRDAGHTSPRVISFEPSQVAFARLLDNLALNRSDAEVFNCAVGEHSGFASFYEPEGHLTNGSFSQEFARIFSSDVRATRTLVISAAEIDALVGVSGRTLVKIDVESAEPLVLRGLRPWLEARLPDIILEVLAEVEPELRAQDFLARLGYRFHRLESTGPIPVAPYQASSSHRDHLLLAPRGLR
jgi:FkbM family methyltransferase